MVASEDRLHSRLLGDSCQGQSLLILKAHGGEAHQIISLRQLFHILAVALQPVDIRHMNCAQIIHMGCQRGQPQIGKACNAVKIRLHYGRGEQQYLHPASSS